MKITFLGTSHGVPAADRFCSCTMLESNGSIYFIDAGAPTIDLLLRAGKNVNDFRALFTTHAHSDHTFGLISMADLMNWYYKESSGDFYLTDSDYIDAIKNVIKKSSNPAGFNFDDERVRFKVAKEGLVYQDENIKIEYFRTMHGGIDSYSILVTEGEKRILFGGDFSYNLRSKDIPKIIEENIDAFICEMAHFGEKELTPYLENCQAKKIFFNHVFPISKYDEDIVNIKNHGYAFDVIAPNDGDSFEI